MCSAEANIGDIKIFGLGHLLCGIVLVAPHSSFDSLACLFAVSCQSLLLK